MDQNKALTQSEKQNVLIQQSKSYSPVKYKKSVCLRAVMFNADVRKKTIHMFTVNSQSLRRTK